MEDVGPQRQRGNGIADSLRLVRNVTEFSGPAKVLNYTKINIFHFTFKKS
jgi:hypothetical protein